MEVACGRVPGRRDLNSGHVCREPEQDRRVMIGAVGSWKLLGDFARRWLTL